MAVKKPTKPKKPAAKAEKAARILQPNKNGVARPKPGTDSAAVWDIADRLSSKGAAAERSAVMEQAGKKNINEATVATQYQRWRVFNGLAGTRSTPVRKAAAKKAKAPAKVKKPAAKKATSEPKAKKPKAKKPKAKKPKAAAPAPAVEAAQ